MSVMYVLTSSSDTNQYYIEKDSTKLKGNISVSCKEATCLMEVYPMILGFVDLQDVSGGVRIDLDF